MSHRVTSMGIPMGQAAQKIVFAAEDFVRWEPAQLDPHEFLDGEVFAMAGAEDRLGARHRPCETIGPCAP